jgi:hypothetical protein
MPNLLEQRGYQASCQFNFITTLDSTLLVATDHQLVFGSDHYPVTLCQDRLELILQPS